MKVKAIIIVGFVVLVLCLVIFLGNGFLQNRMLLDAIEANDYDGARIAVKSGAFLEVPRHLIAIPEIVMTNPTPLIAACKKGNQNIVALLLEHGADVNKRDNCTDETPLLAALQGAKQNRYSLAFFLIEKGADIHMVQPGTNSALQETLLVLPEDSEETVAEGFLLFQYLMKEDVDKAIQLPWESTLTHAVHYGNYNVVCFLLEKGHFAVNEFDPRGNTALIVAAQCNHLDIVKFLLDFGASKSLTDSTGKTAYDYAAEKGYTEIAELLRSD